MEKTEEGTLLYKNWLSQINNNPIFSTNEYPFFSDSYLTGEITESLGPNYLINTLPLIKNNNISPIIIFRIDNHIHPDDTLKNMKQTDISTYHGGWLNDEMAALISLCLGIRLKSGGIIRTFGLDADPKGRPQYHFLNEEPVFIKKTDNQYIIPNAICKHCLKDATKLLVTFPKITPEESTVLIKSARLYQEALWLSESEPELTWLLLVSSVETVANFWNKSIISSPVEKLKYFNDNLYKILLTKGDEKFINLVAVEITNYMGATKKFVDFILKFLPSPPSNRSQSLINQHNWDNQAMEKSLKIIYNWRSRALHSGIPFPKPMCFPPNKIEEGYSEKVDGLATQTKQGVWKNEDTPMLLHLFEYITRNVLLKWWHSLIKN